MTILSREDSHRCEELLEANWDMLTYNSNRPATLSQIERQLKSERITSSDIILNS